MNEAGSIRILTSEREIKQVRVYSELIAGQYNKYLKLWDLGQTTRAKIEGYYGVICENALSFEWIYGTIYNNIWWTFFISERVRDNMLKAFKIEENPIFNETINQYIKQLIRFNNKLVNDIIYRVITLVPEIRLFDPVVNFRGCLTITEMSHGGDFAYSRTMGLSTFLEKYRLLIAFNYRLKIKRSNVCLKDEKCSYFDMETFLNAGKLYTRYPEEDFIIRGNYSLKSYKELKYQIISHFMKVHYELEYIPIDIYNEWTSCVSLLVSDNGDGSIMLEITDKNSDFNSESRYYLIMMEFDRLYCACVNFTDDDLKKLVIRK